MAETPFADTEALLALLRGDTEAAQNIIDEMLPGERRTLHEAARELANRSDDRNRCGGCGRYIDTNDARHDITVGRLGGPTTRWHRNCYQPSARST